MNCPYNLWFDRLTTNRLTCKTKRGSALRAEPLLNLLNCGSLLQGVGAMLLG